MKNLHVLPTDKPSRLVIDTIENKLYLQPILHEKTINVLPQHIYITSDKEIKEGDWCYAILSKQVFKNANPNLKSEDKKKIILTTDPSLAPDVQKIDDEFLEWFVQNPSCEHVKTDLVPVNYFGSETIVNSYGFNKFIYKIIIPQEEPKQETLEEAAERFYPLSKGGSMWMPSADDCNKANKQEGFIEGAKSDAARDYWFEQFKKKGGDK
jgi:hypothetical protein